MGVGACRGSTVIASDAYARWFQVERWFESDAKCGGGVVDVALDLVGGRARYQRHMGSGGAVGSGGHLVIDSDQIFSWTSSSGRILPRRR